MTQMGADRRGSGLTAKNAENAEKSGSERAGVNYDMMITAATGLGAALGGCGLSWWMIKGEYLELRAEVKRLRECELAEVKTRVGKIEDKCKAEVNAATLDSLKPTLLRIEDNQMQMGKDIATIKQWEGWISDVRAEGRRIDERLRQHLEARSHGG